MSNIIKQYAEQQLMLAQNNHKRLLFLSDTCAQSATDFLELGKVDQVSVQSDLAMEYGKAARLAEKVMCFWEAAVDNAHNPDALASLFLQTGV